jgi:hypothetical protein
MFVQLSGKVKSTEINFTSKLLATDAESFLQSRDEGEVLLLGIKIFFFAAAHGKKNYFCINLSFSISFAACRDFEMKWSVGACLSVKAERTEQSFPR